MSEIIFITQHTVTELGIAASVHTAVALQNNNVAVIQFWFLKELKDGGKYFKEPKENEVTKKLIHLF